jgi:hypothetical protein
MQTPYGAGAPPPRRGVNPWTVVGIGCGGCLLVCIVLAIAFGAFAGRVFRGITSEVNTPTVPPPQEYVGLWKGSEGGMLNIGSDGRGSWSENRRSGMTSSNFHIDGGRVTIDPAGGKLSVTFGGFGKTMRMDKPPTEGPNGREMVLDGETFKHVGQFVPDKPAGGGPVRSSGGSDGAQ